jgi:hypothetical protein
MVMVNGEARENCSVLLSTFHQRRHIILRGYSATTKMPKVTFNMCLEQAKLTIQSASSDQDRLIALYACLIKLAAIFRKGCSAAELGMSSHEVIVSTTRVMQPCRKNGTSCIPLPLQAQPIPARINTTTTT